MFLPMTPITADLLVSYPWRRVGPARREILRTLKRLGDEHARVERSDVDGVALVHTNLDGREVVHRCRASCFARRRRSNSRSSGCRSTTGATPISTP